MKKRILIAIATLVALTACSNGRLVLENSFWLKLLATKPKASRPLVYVDIPAAGATPVVILDQEPIRYKVHKSGTTYQPVAIEFLLQTSGYIFAPQNSGDPIVLTAIKGTSLPVPPVTCTFAQGDPTDMICSYQPTVVPARYSYTLRVQDTTLSTYLVSDPTVMHD